MLKVLTEERLPVHSRWVSVLEIWVSYSLFYISRIRQYIAKSLVGLSIILSIHLRGFFHDGRMDFLCIWYHDQVPWAADTHRIKNLVLCYILVIIAIFFINCVSLL